MMGTSTLRHVYYLLKRGTGEGVHSYCYGIVEIQEECGSSYGNANNGKYRGRIIVKYIQSFG